MAPTSASRFALKKLETKTALDERRYIAQNSYLVTISGPIIEYGSQVDSAGM